MRREVYRVISAASFIAAIFSILIFPGISPADTLTFQLDYVFSGHSPSGSSPWLTATFVDIGPNTVELTMTNNLINNQYVDGSPYGYYVAGGWFFNINSNRLNGLNIQFVSGEKAAQTLKGNDASSASYYSNAGGYYDIVFSWIKFSGGDTAVYDLTASGLTVADFNYLSSPWYSNDPFYSAAKVINGSVSGWVAATDAVTPVPEPSTLFLLGSGLVGLGLWGKRRFKARS